MSERNTVVRSMHDLGLAAWLGGSLAGAVGINGAAAVVPDEKLRLVVANAGLACWTPGQPCRDRRVPPAKITSRVPAVQGADSPAGHLCLVAHPVSDMFADHDAGEVDVCAWEWSA